MKITKSQLTQIIQEEIGGISKEARLKDDLQTVMVDSAVSFLHKIYGNSIPDVGKRSEHVHEIILDLEEKIVDAMVDFRVPGLPAQAGEEGL